MVNLIDAVSEDFEFRVVTSDSDLGEDMPYENVVEGLRKSSRKASVLCLALDHMSLSKWRCLLNSDSYDLLCLSSSFCKLVVRTLLLHAQGAIPNKLAIVVPKREVSSAAFSMGMLKILNR